MRDRATMALAVAGVVLLVGVYGLGVAFLVYLVVLAARVLVS